MDVVVVEAGQQQAARRLDEGLARLGRKLPQPGDAAARDANIRQPSVDQFRPTDQQGAGALGRQLASASMRRTSRRSSLPISL